MRKWIMPRGTGKTTQLIIESANTGAIIICCNKSQAEYIKKKATQLGLAIENPISLLELLIVRENKEGRKYLIDNLSECLTRINVVGYSDSWKGDNIETIS